MRKWVAGATAVLAVLAGVAVERVHRPTRWIWGRSDRAVIFFHGAGVAGDPHAGEASALLHRFHDMGWTVAADHAGGDAWGNPASQRDYRDLVTALHRRGVSRLVGVAESMGTLDALPLLRDRTLTRLWAVSPVGDLTQMADTTFRPTIISAWHGEPPASASPVTWPPQRLPLTLVVDPADPVVPATANAEVLAAHFHAQLLTCHGGHVAPACFDLIAQGAV